MPRLRSLPCVFLLLILAVTLATAPPAMAATPSTSSPVLWALDWLGSLLTLEPATAGSETFPNQDPNGVETIAPVPSGDGTETLSAETPEGEAFPNQDPNG